MLPFSYQLPLTFSEDGPDGPAERQLPPTYLYHYEGIPGIRAQVAYSVKVLIERKVFLKISRKHMLVASAICLSETTNTSAIRLRIAFNYTPRTRPHVPGPPAGSSFTALMKQTPDDWAAFSNDVPRRTDPTNGQVQHVQDSTLINGETVTSAVSMAPWNLQATSNLALFYSSSYLQPKPSP